MKRQHPDNPNLFWCPKCQTYKARGEFHENKSLGHGGLHCPCKVCRKDESRLRRINHKAFLKVKDREYQQKNWGAHLNRCKKHYSRSITELSDWYIKQAIKHTASGSGIASNEINPAIIEIKRQQIIMKRTLRDFKKWIEEKRVTG